MLIHHLLTTVQRAVSAIPMTSGLAAPDVSILRESWIQLRCSALVFRFLKVEPLRGDHPGSASNIIWSFLSLSAKAQPPSGNKISITYIRSETGLRHARAVVHSRFNLLGSRFDRPVVA